MKGLYAITDQNMPTDKMLAYVQEALQGGVTLLQYRNKIASPKQKHHEASQLLRLCHQYQCPLIINDDLQLAIDIKADGIHLGQQDGSASNARKQLGPSAIIGVTCHDSLNLAIQAQQQKASYVAFGRFFPSASKPNASPAALKILEQAQKYLQIPIVAIGGINLHNAHQVIQAGADMVAVIEGLYNAEDIRSRASQFKQLFRQD